MAKRFNGRKFSHGLMQRSRAKCPLCGSQLVRVQGALRCTEMKSGKKKGSSSYRVIKHGSLRTIAKRQEQAAHTAGASSR